MNPSVETSRTAITGYHTGATLARAFSLELEAMLELKVVYPYSSHLNSTTSTANNNYSTTQAAEIKSAKRDSVRTSAALCLLVVCLFSQNSKRDSDF